MVRIAATTVNDLRTWDGYVTAALRTGDLRALSVEQDPSLPARRVERMQQYYQGVPIFGAQIVRDSDAGVAQSIFGEVPQTFTLDTRPGTDCRGGRAGDHCPGGRQRTTAAPDRTDHPSDGRQRASPGLRHGRLLVARSVFRLFIDANTGAELLRFSELQTQSAVGTGRGLVGDTKKLSVRPLGAGVRR